jgi:hypothetical protein
LELKDRKLLKGRACFIIFCSACVFATSCSEGTFSISVDAADMVERDDFDGGDATSDGQDTDNGSDPFDESSDALDIPTQTTECTTVSPDNIPILVLSYCPLDPSNNDNIDPTITGIENMLISTLQENVVVGTDGMIGILTEGSRYRGSGEPALNHCIFEAMEIYSPLPLSDACVPWNCPNEFGETWYRPDYYKLLSRDECRTSTDIQGITYDCNLSINICDYVDNNGVKEVWMWGYHGGITEGVESNMSMGTDSQAFWNHGTYGDVSNSERTDDLPVCRKTYTLYGFNYMRVDTAAANIHNQMHQFESVFGWLNQDLFWDQYVGPFENYGNPNTEETFYRCGWCHYPPNGASDYDYANTHYVWTDCFDWRPGGTGTKEYVNCEKWNCKEGGFDTLWMQSIPNEGNTLTYNGNPLRNWWEFFVALDSALQAGNNLVY